MSKAFQFQYIRNVSPGQSLALSGENMERVEEGDVE